MRFVNVRRTPAVVAAVVVIVALMGVILAGCGSATTTTTAATAGSDTTAAATSSSDTTVAALKAALTGAGATFPEPLYVEWAGEFGASVQPGVTINYQGVGSGGGIQQFTAMTVDFGASDAPMKDEEITAAEAASGAKVLHIPTVMGAVVAAYNVDGLTELKLDSDTLAAIFLGTVKKWNDPKIAALNPGATLPDSAIQVVHRSDSSGTTNIFTSYLTKVNPEWASKVGKGKEVKWPVGVGGQGNSGVAAVIQQQKGSVGYVELSYALENKFTMASLKNKSGNFIVPSLESTAAALEGADIPADLRFSVADSSGAQAYPIVGATWILAYDVMKDAAKADALKAFLTWALTDGTSIAEELNYAPLNASLQALALAKVDMIHGG
jgi:phosphate transport system substrate-binding protein